MSLLAIYFTHGCPYFIIQSFIFTERMNLVYFSSKTVQTTFCDLYFIFDQSIRIYNIDLRIIISTFYMPVERQDVLWNRPVRLSVRLSTIACERDILKTACRIDFTF